MSDVCDAIFRATARGHRVSVERWSEMPRWVDDGAKLEIYGAVGRPRKVRILCRQCDYYIVEWEDGDP